MPGFTLIELLIALALIASIASFSVYGSLGSFQRTYQEIREELYASIDMEARGETLRHICRGSTCTRSAHHGSHVDTDGITLFQGNSYMTRDLEEDIFFPL